MTIVKNKIISFVGLPWSGKTFLAVQMASTYPRWTIYSNVDIYENWKLISKPIRDIDDLERIPFTDEKGVILLDELWVNNNSRRAMSESNLIFWRLAMLWRKLNKDIYHIAQLEAMNDKYFRELSEYRFELDSYFVAWKKDYLEYQAKIYNRQGYLVKIVQIDLIKWCELSGISYNSLERSVIAK